MARTEEDPRRVSDGAETSEKVLCLLLHQQTAITRCQKDERGFLQSDMLKTKIDLSCT